VIENRPLTWLSSLKSMAAPPEIVVDVRSSTTRWPKDVAVASDCRFPYQLRIISRSGKKGWRTIVTTR